MGRALKSLLNRFFHFFISLLILIFLTFGLLRFFPGSPWNEEKNLDPQVLAQLQKFYGLNQSLSEQFFTYLQRLASGDLGMSMHFPGRSVSSLIWEFGKTSAFLGLSAFLLALVLALTYLLVTRQMKTIRSFSDRWLLILMSLPTLVLAPFCIWLFSVQLQIFPVALLESPLSYVLPVILLSIKPGIALARVLAASVDQILSEQFIQTARSFGYSESSILMKWALKNALTSFLTQAGPLFASLISGSFLIEVLFAIPGLGFQFIESVLNRDWPLILGLTLVYGTLLMLTQMLTDLLILWMDPRVEAL
jgi:oligopeptide transport system permease protein